jgi:hypothetical protein
MRRRLRPALRRLTKSSGNVGKHDERCPRITGVIEMLIHKIEYEESNHCGQCDSHGRNMTSKN